MMRWCVLLCVVSMVSASLGQEVLRSAAEVRALAADRAALGVPVELEAVVGYVDAGSTVFAQDAGGGTFFRGSGAAGQVFVPGDRVRVRGVTLPGLYLPGIDAREVVRLGGGAPPEPVEADYEDLASGRWHYQRVRVEGVGRRVSVLDENRTLLHVALGRRVVEVRVDAPQDGRALVGARLGVTGLAAGGINDRRQLVFPYLRVTDWAEVEVLREAPEVESLAVMPAWRLLGFDPGMSATGGERVRLSGVVLAAFEDGRVFLRQAAPEALPAPDPKLVPNQEWPERRAVAVEARLTESVRVMPGQVVELAGFPNMEGFSASLADAVLVRVEGGAGVESPVEVTARAWASGAYDADLVVFSGLVQDVFRAAGGVELRVRLEDAVVQALLPGVEALDLPMGSRVRLTGICRVESSTDRGFRSQPERVTLLLRSAADAVLLAAPSWWTARRLAGLAAFLTAALVLALLWSSLLRRQVTRQAAVLAERLARQAALEERQRIAREFHDTLEQELAGLNLRLDAALTRPLEEKARGLLGASRHLVGRIQSEARNLVADLRSDPELVPDLHEALGEIATRLQGSALPEVRVVFVGELPALPAHVVHHLRMAAGEAVTNAMKHAEARHITLQAEVVGGELVLEVADDGKGLPVGATEGLPGHFGCMGIRERCLKIGARVEWLGREGGGTRVRVRLPLT